MRAGATDYLVKPVAPDRMMLALRKRPVSAEALDRWRGFEPWLQPLADALGDVLGHYPDDPPSVRAP